MVNNLTYNNAITGYGSTKALISAVCVLLLACIISMAIPVEIASTPVNKQSCEECNKTKIGVNLCISMSLLATLCGLLMFIVASNRRLSRGFGWFSLLQELFIVPAFT